MAKMIKNLPVKSEAKQFDRFLETARKLGCDEDKERFENSLGKIAAYKPPREPRKEAKKVKTKKPRAGT
jgi:hypothetical protein